MKTSRSLGVTGIGLVAATALGYADDKLLHAMTPKQDNSPQSATTPSGLATGHSNRVLVRFKAGLTRNAKKLKREQYGGRQVLRSFRSFPDIELIAVDTESRDQVLRRLNADPDVLYAEPDYPLELFEIPNDPSFARHWSLHNTGQSVSGDFCHSRSLPEADIRVADAWNVWTGDPEFRIAIIDTGINYVHPDLRDNVWTNPGESSGDANSDGCPGLCGTDDDGDGLVDEDSMDRQPGEPEYANDRAADDDENGWNDDIHGYDFINEDSDPLDDNSHGSHVAGTIGAVGNNGLGVTGINWRCSLVGLKIFVASGAGSAISEAIEALDYITVNRIRVSNSSWGSRAGPSQSLRDAILAVQDAGHLMVVAAGNNFELNIDAYGVYPAAYDLPNVITVAASDNRDLPAAFSNRGRASVDLAAPGTCILSTLLGENYGYKDGTSMAAPHVTGVAALLMSRRPDFSWREVKQRLMITARPVPIYNGLSVTGGIVNAAAAVGDCNGNGILDEREPEGPSPRPCVRNGIPDECELDCNRNGVPDSCDLFQKRSTDCDRDGVPDECQPDCDRNGIADSCDLEHGTAVNCNRNAIPDECELASAGTDENGLCSGEICLPDCNANEIPDECDVNSGISSDCSRNLILDECEPDCNENGVADSCDIARGVSRDCSRNGIPDECEPDCNGNDISDSCDIQADIDADCDDNGIPDSCEPGSLPDCDGNGVADPCDLRAATRFDCDESGTLDFCQIRDDPTLDMNGNGIPDGCDGRGLRLVPVAVGGEAVPETDELVLLGGGHRITFEIRMSGWDADRNGTPRLRGYEVRIPGSGFSSGEYGALAVARFPCANTADCPRGSACQANGSCELSASAFIDPSRTDFVFSELLPLRLTFQTLPSGSVAFLSIAWSPNDAVVDPGETKYGGTLILDVPELAAGVFTLGFQPQITRWVNFDDETIRIPTFVPARVRILADCNRNRTVDDQDISAGTSLDCNTNGIPDECVALEADCNQNRIPDSCDLAAGSSPDCDGNGVPDECPMPRGDCNANGRPDICELRDGSAPDCNQNHVPDSCDIDEGTSRDCNRNGVPDECVLYEPDCDGNGRPDSCDLAGNPQRDCNGNATLDSCDIAAGSSRDQDGDGIPDECRAILHVPQQYANLRSAIVAARSGDWILVDDGVYSGSENTDLSLLGKVLTLRGRNGPARCIIDGEQKAGGFRFGGNDSTSILDGFTIRRCVGSDGGAIACTRGSPTIRRCWFVENHAVGIGGAISCIQASHPRISECRFVGNRSGSGGGAIGCDRQSSPSVRNCLLLGNSSEQSGGAFFLDNLSLATIEHCTIVANSAAIGGALFTARTRIIAPGFNAPIVRNSILWDNRATESSAQEIAVTAGAQLLVEFSDIRGGLSLSSVDLFGVLRWGEGNVDAAPRFLDPDGPDGDATSRQAGNYRLHAASSCIDAGTSIPASSDVDLDGLPRLRCQTVDLGAYEGGFADLDCDRKTGLSELGDYFDCWSGPRGGDKLNSKTVCFVFDFEKDADVDLRDFAALQNRYGSETIPGP